MPGSTESEAIENYVGPIQRSVSCLTPTPLVYSAHEEFQYALQFEGKPPQAALSDSGMFLVFTQGFSVVNRIFGDWKVSTHAYVYVIRDARGSLFSYDWHPHRHDKTIPHFHIKQGASYREMNQCHFPSGRIAIETLVRFLIEEMSVQPIRHDWDRVLSENQQRFEAHRSWV